MRPEKNRAAGDSAAAMVESGDRRTTNRGSVTATARPQGESPVRYLCLVYQEEKQLASLSQRELDSLVEESLAVDEELKRGGNCLASDALQPVATATTVRVRNGKLSITDGPFAETKEQLGGFWLIEARDLNEAVQIAGRLPPAQRGSVEVRPVWDIREKERRTDR
jgi:hypothetical protein